MDRFICPDCNQGWVVPARIIVTQEAIWVCEECDSLWRGTERPNGRACDNLERYLESLGLPPFWSELDVS